MKMKKPEFRVLWFFLSSGERIRTTDLRVMSPTSYLCSTPQWEQYYRGLKSKSQGRDYYKSIKIYVHALSLRLLAHRALSGLSLRQHARTDQQLLQLLGDFFAAVGLHFQRQFFQQVGGVLFRLFQ